MSKIIIPFIIQRSKFQKNEILVSHRLAVPTHSARRFRIKLFALVCPHILVVLPRVDLNVPFLLSVLLTKRVLIRNVLTPVQVFVVVMRSVEYATIVRCVIVPLVLQVTLSQDVTPFHVRNIQLFLKNF